jgi:hypothetical protein
MNAGTQPFNPNMAPLLRDDSAHVVVFGVTDLDALHPAGRCTCAGEGRCDWCTSVALCGCKRCECLGCGS